MTYQEVLDYNNLHIRNETGIEGITRGEVAQSIENAATYSKETTDATNIAVGQLSIDLGTLSGTVGGHTTQISTLNTNVGTLQTGKQNVLNGTGYVKMSGASIGYVTTIPSADLSTIAGLPASPTKYNNANVTVNNKGQVVAIEEGTVTPPSPIDYTWNAIDATGGTATINATGNKRNFMVTLSVAVTTLAIANPVEGVEYKLSVIQGTGGNKKLKPPVTAKVPIGFSASGNLVTGTAVGEEDWFTIVIKSGVMYIFPAGLSMVTV